jgi:hypothetical protein
MITMTTMNNYGRRQFLRPEIIYQVGLRLGVFVRFIIQRKIGKNPDGFAPD